MVYLKICFAFLILRLTTSTEIEEPLDKLSELNQLVQDAGITVQKYGRTKNTIFINAKQRDIFMYTNDEFASDSEKNLPKIYICINCVFAGWIHGELRKVINLKRTLFPETLGTQIKRMKTSIKYFEHLQYYIKRLIDILLNFTSIYSSEYDTTNNTDVLRSLLSLSFKLNSLSTLSAQPNSSIDKNMLDTYRRVMLGEINSIQRFLFLNCKLPPDYKHYFDDISLTSVDYQNDKDFNNIYTFLEEIQPLNLDTQISCNVTQCTLQDMVPTEFYDVQWRTKYGMVTVKAVLDGVKQTTDLDVIFWYQNNLFNTILKTLVIKILEHLRQKSRILKFSRRVIRQLYSILLSTNINIPFNLMNAFFILIQNHREKNSKVDEALGMFSEYISSLPSVQFNGDVNSDRKSDVGSKSVNKPSSDVNNFTLDEFTAFLNTIMEDFVCFIRMFQFLADENDTYHVSFLEKSEKINAFARELTNNVNNNTLATEEFKQPNEKLIQSMGCTCFKGLYHFSDSAIKYLYDAQDKNIDKSTKNKYLYETHSILKNISYLLYEFIKYHWYVHHYKIVYNVLPLVEMAQDVVVERFHIPKRLLMGIMNELNAYSIEFCDGPAYNALSFKRINQKSDNIYDGIMKSMTALKENNNNKIYCNYSNMLDLITILNDTYGYGNFVKYNSLVNIYWRGMKTNIGVIHDSLRFSISSPHDYYLLYDIYIKFSLAVLYYEIYQLLDPDIELMIYQKQYDLSIKGLAKRFSRIFNDVIQFIDRYVKSYNHLMNTNRELRDQLVMKIISQFEEIGVFIDSNLLEKKMVSKTYGSNDMSEEDNESPKSSNYIGINDIAQLLPDLAKILTFIEIVNRHYLDSCVSREEVFTMDV